jgi:hypothetical protein
MIRPSCLRWLGFGGTVTAVLLLFHCAASFSPVHREISDASAGESLSIAGDGGEATLHCPWAFLRDEPSLYEMRYREHIKEIEAAGSRLCSLMVRDERFRELHAAYVAALGALAPDPIEHPIPGRCANTTTNVASEPDSDPRLDDRVFSRMIYARRCAGMTHQAEGADRDRRVVSVPIEPLVAALRHPRLCEVPPGGVRNAKWLVHRNYMAVDPWVAHRRRAPSVALPSGETGDETLLPTNSNVSSRSANEVASARKVAIVDVGASLWLAADGAQRWLVGSVRHWQCLQPTEYHAWEATPKSQDPTRGVPKWLEPGYHYHAVPVVSTSTDPDRNPLELIRRRFSPADHVVLKIDFDTPGAEAQLIEQILSDQTLAERIDELYFEHHVKLAPMVENWGRESVRGSVLESLNLFDSLRRLGIHAHSWV